MKITIQLEHTLHGVVVREERLVEGEIVHKNRCARTLRVVLEKTMAEALNQLGVPEER